MFRLLTPLIILILVSISLLILEERKTFDVRSLVQTDPIPHTQQLIKEEKYAQAEEHLSYFLEYDYVKKNPQALELMKIIQTKRDSLSYKTEKFWEGVLKGKSDEDIGRVAAVASDFLVIGDIRDLSIEGMHYANDEKVDTFMVSLSTLGLIATASTVYSLGAVAPIKSSISLLKQGKRANKIPHWLQTKLVTEVEAVKKTKSLTNIESLMTPIHQMYQKIGLPQTLHLVSKSRNLKDLKQFNKFSTRFGNKSQTLLAVTNNKAIKYMDKMPKTTQKNFLYASTYGDNGLKGMHKLGENKFLKRVGFHANLAKTTYKGNLNSLFNALLKLIPNSLLYIISFFGLFYFIRKFYTFARRVF